MPLTKAPESPQAVAAPPAPASDRMRIPFVLCLLVILGWVVRDLVVHAAAIRRHVGLPFQVDYEEGNILNAAVRITHGLTPYPNPHAIPNVINPYGPVAYYLLALPVKLFGVSFLWPRLVIVVSVIAICCFIGLTIARLSGSALAGIVLGAMYGTLPVVESWSAVLRVDFLALAFCAAGVYVFCRGVTNGASQTTRDCSSGQVSEESDNRQSTIGNSFVLTSAALFAAAILVKHTFLAAPAACVLYLMSARQWKSALRFAGLMAAIVAAVLLLFTAITRGAILTDLLLTHPDPFSWDVYLFRMTGIMAMCRVLAVLAAFCLVNELLQRRLSVPTLWLLLASGTAITAGKLGSNWNHFLEWPAALCVCAGLGWDILSRTRPRALALVVALVVTTWMWIVLSRERQLPFDPWATVQDCGRVYEMVKNYPGDRIYSENVGALVLSGKTVWVSNPFVYSQLAMRGGWSDAALERMVRNREFDLIITQWDYPVFPNFRREGAERASPALIEAIGDNYRRREQLYGCTDARVVFERK